MTLNEWINKKVTACEEIMGGEAVFRGTRVTIKRVALLAKQWVTYSQMFADYPFLTTEDIRHAVQFHNKSCLQNT
jgi:uncharacterized protein (DUF433 family)